MSEKKNIAIVGAGPAGLTAAYLLSKSKNNVEIFESSDSVGGMSKTINLWGQKVDLGPHRFFSSDPRVNKLWLEVVKKDYKMVKRLTRIFYQKKFYDYPLKPINALTNLGILESIKCIISYFYSKIFQLKNQNSFEDWVINRFGKRLFKIFFKSYSEKLWGISCDKLDSDFAKQRIKKLSLFEAIKAAILGNNNHHKTLVDEFAYPNGGTGMVYQNMEKMILKNGGKIFLNTKVKKIYENKESKINIDFFSAKTRVYDHVISTMPINYLVRGMNAPNKILHYASKLKFRNTILVYFKISNYNPFPDQWIYVHSPIIKTGRITNFKNWTPEINNGKNETIICMEYWCNDDELWFDKNNDKLINLAKKDLNQSNLDIPQIEKINNFKVIRIPKCYPIYEKGYKKNLIPIQRFLKEKKNIIAIGRYGSFKYNNQDHSILMGILASENILNNSNHDLFDINTDYEYQESSRIDATGLV